MSPQRVQRQRTKGWRKPEGAVYVGRGSKWGNPLRVCEEWPTAKQVVSLFRDLVSIGEAWWISDEGTRWEQRNRWRLSALERQSLNPETIRAELAGKDLMCWCPLHQPCHADVLLELANGDRLPVGTPVLYWPGGRRGPGRPSVTRTPIWKMGDGTEVVSVEDYPGGIALTHVQPLGQDAEGVGLVQAIHKRKAAALLLEGGQDAAGETDHGHDDAGGEGQPDAGGGRPAGGEDQGDQHAHDEHDDAASEHETGAGPLGGSPSGCHAGQLTAAGDPCDHGPVDACRCTLTKEDNTWT